MEISDINELPFLTDKKSKAHLKMLAYLDELLRNIHFKKRLKLIKKEKSKKDNFKKLTAVHSLITRYERLKRDTLSIVKNRYVKLVESTINEYGISYDAIELAMAMLDNDYEYVKLYKHDVHLCTINDDYFNYLDPLNPADEFIYLNPKLKRRVLAFPISIGMSPRATKTDIIDFIDKNWWWIKDGLDKHGLKPLRIRKRKHNKEILNLIWENNNRKLKEIKKIINTKYPKSSFTYSEIQDLITYEKKKRLKKLT